MTKIKVESKDTRLEVYTKACYFKHLLKDDVPKYPRLVYFLNDVCSKERTDKDIANDYPLWGRHDLRVLIMDSLKIKNYEFSAFLYGLFDSDEFFLE